MFHGQGKTDRNVQFQTVFISGKQDLRMSGVQALESNNMLNLF